VEWEGRLVYEDDLEFDGHIEIEAGLGLVFLILDRHVKATSGLLE
jgi:hypothetical protein